MSHKWCSLLLLLWTIANGPSPVLGSGRGDNSTLVETHSPDNGSRAVGLRKSTSGVKSEFVILTSSLGGDKKFSKVRRFKRQTSTEYLKVRLSSGSYVYRPITTNAPSQNSSRELTRVPRGDGSNKRGKGGYGYSKPKGYTYTTPAPVVRVTEQVIDSEAVTPPRPPAQAPSSSFRTTTTTEDPIDVRDTIPGEPGKDYQALSSIPKTTFTCEGRAPGFYADVEAGCQVFHRCTDDPWYTGQVRVIMDSFLCPNGSLFNQQIFACDWWGNTDCRSSEEFFELNQQIGQLEETDAGTVQYVKFTGIRVPSPPGTKKVAPTIVPKAERKPLPDRFKTKSKASISKDNEPGSRPLENEHGDEEELIQEFFGGDDQDFRPLSSQVDSGSGSEEDERQGSSQNLDEVQQEISSKKSRKKSSRKFTTTTTTPVPTSSSEESSSEETQEPSAATNNNARPLVVNRERGDTGEAATPPGTLEPPDFDGNPVSREGDRDDDDSSTRSPSANTPSGKQEYRDEYLPPKESRGYSYPKPDKGYLPPGKDYLPPSDGRRPSNDYLPPRGEYLSGTSPSTNQYLPPTTQSPYTTPSRDYLPPGDSYSTLGLNTYSPTPDSYYRKPSTGYGTPVTSPYSDYLPPTPPSREYGQPNRDSSYLPPSRDYGTPNQQSRDYLPPNREYGTPNKQSGDSYLPPKKDYLPPGKEYGTPNNDYLPPKKDYLPPSNEYGTPNRGNNDYLPPKKDYLPPKQGYGTPNNGYLPPSKDYGTPNNGYLPPSKEYGTPNNNNNNNGYIPPSKDHGANNGYLPPGKEYGTPTNSYLPPGKEYGAPNKDYLPPRSNQNQYLPPNKDYGPPAHHAFSYGTPQSGGYTYYPDQTTVTEHWPAKYSYEAPVTPNTFLQNYASNYPSSGTGYDFGGVRSHYDATSTTYLPPQPTSPSKDYGAPQHQSGNYLPPSNQYNAPQQGNSYLPPQKPNSEYGQPQQGNNYLPPQKPNSEYGQPRPGNDYLPPQKPNNEYGQPRPDNNYLPPQKPSNEYGQPRPGNDYLPPQKPSNEYGQPRPGNDYLPPNKPSNDYGQPRPGNDYLPPQKPNNEYGQPTNDYLPPQKPSNDYGQPRPGNDYLPPQKPNNEYGQPRPGNDYLPPQKPNNEYLPPGQDNNGFKQSPGQDYGSPNPTGYSTLPDHILKDYNPAPTPTPPSLYTTIPEQTPPPIFDSGQPSVTGLYAISPPKIDILSVPLVSYSHVVNPILAEFSPFKKR